MKLEIYDSEQKKLLYLKNVQAADVIKSFQRFAFQGILHWWSNTRTRLPFW